jgi:recombinational DNA repair ATPase RecF
MAQSDGLVETRHKQKAEVFHKHSVDVDNRLHQLREAREKVEKHRTELLQQAEEEKYHLAVIDGQLAERGMDVINDRHDIKLPTYDKPSDLQKAIDDRGNAFGNKTESQIKEERETLYKKEAKDWVVEISKDNNESNQEQAE